MYIVGIVGRAYYNKDNQKIIQTHEAIRKFLSQEENIICITILPTEDENYIDIIPGEDKISEKKLDYFKNSNGRKNISKVLNIDCSKYKKIIIYMPTFKKGFINIAIL